MPEKIDEPGFSEGEFALILRRATELDAGSAVVRPTPPPKMPPGGRPGDRGDGGRGGGGRVWRGPYHLDHQYTEVAGPSKTFDFRRSGGSRPRRGFAQVRAPSSRAPIEMSLSVYRTFLFANP